MQDAHSRETGMNGLSLLVPAGNSISETNTPIRTVGIDLGTTNSSVAEVIWLPGAPVETARSLEVDQSTEGGTYTNVVIPSVVAIYGGEIWVGEGAKRLRAKGVGAGLRQGRNLFYECKNEIGTNRTYFRAPEGFKTPREVSGQILKYLRQSVLDEREQPIDSAVVTVPASFQSAQRHDTLLAAEQAGFVLTGGHLLDEPIAAFIDYLISYGPSLLSQLKDRKNLVVFDFGGGTCDVAVFCIQLLGGRLEMTPLSVSRYHRLGGCDIDRAVLYDILLPQILEQNALGVHGLGFDEKKKIIEPAFLSIAENLKIGITTEINRRLSFDRYEDEDKSQITALQPGFHSCILGDTTIGLKSPQITAEQFEALLEPFLDQDILYPKETEYRWTCSIFSPLSDAVESAGLKPGEVDFCLVAGGSSLIPQVIDAVSDYFANGQVLEYPDKESWQTSVARGAAYHALSLASFGTGLVQPVCHKTISIRTVSGTEALIPKDASLPYPSDGSFARLSSLAVPETSIVDPFNLKVEIIADGDKQLDGQLLFRGNWLIQAPVNKGEALCLEYRLDENQVLELRLYLADRDNGADCFEGTIENPLTNVVNPTSVREEIEELESRLPQLPRHEQPGVIVELAKKYAELGQYEKSIHYLKTVLRVQSSLDVLNKLGLYSGKIKDWDRERKYFKEAAEQFSFMGAWFNLALSLRRRRQYQNAIDAVEKAIDGEPDPPYIVLRAMLAEQVGEEEDRDVYLKEALGLFDPVSTLDDWELHWYLVAAQMADDKQAISLAQAEQGKRGKEPIVKRRGEFPAIQSALKERS